MHLKAFVPLHIIGEGQVSYVPRRDVGCSVPGMEGRHHKCHTSDLRLTFFMIPCMLAPWHYITVADLHRRDLWLWCNTMLYFFVLCLS